MLTKLIAKFILLLLLNNHYCHCDCLIILLFKFILFVLISTSLSKFVFDNRFLLPKHESPATEKNLSIGAEDAGITSTSHATADKVGNNDSDFTQ